MFVKIFCNNCGKEIEVDLYKANFDGRFCSMDCNNEFNLKKSPCIVGDKIKNAK